MTKTSSLVKKLTFPTAYHPAVVKTGPLPSRAEKTPAPVKLPKGTPAPFTPLLVLAGRFRGRRCFLLPTPETLLARGLLLVSAPPHMPPRVVPRGICQPLTPLFKDAPAGLVSKVEAAVKIFDPSTEEGKKELAHAKASRAARKKAIDSLFADSSNDAGRELSEARKATKVAVFDALKELIKSHPEAAMVEKYIKSKFSLTKGGKAHHEIVF